MKVLLSISLHARRLLLLLPLLPWLPPLVLERYGSLRVLKDWDSLAPGEEKWQWNYCLIAGA